MSFFEIFQPEARHLREEKDRQKMLVSKPTPGGGAPLGIDLANGVATITIRAKPAAQSAPEAQPENIPPADDVEPDGQTDNRGTLTPPVSE